MTDKGFDEYGNYGENNPPIREMTDEERQAAKDRAVANSEQLTEEEKVAYINSRAHVILAQLFEQYEETLPEGEEQLEFVSDIYARMVLLSIFGFNPEKLAVTANEAADRLIEHFGDSDD